MARSLISDTISFASCFDREPNIFFRNVFISRSILFLYNPFKSAINNSYTNEISSTVRVTCQ